MRVTDFMRLKTVELLIIYRFLFIHKGITLSVKKVNFGDKISYKIIKWPMRFWEKLERVFYKFYQ